MEALYRYQLYVGGRYNVVSGETLAADSDVSSTRIEVGGGWFVTPDTLLEVEYAQQTWNDYLSSDVLHGGEFSGFTLEGVVAF